MNAEEIRAIATSLQPAPIPNDEPSCHELLIEAVRARMEFGLQSYGQPLQAHNGRNQLAEKLQEQIDDAAYTIALIREWDALLVRMIKLEAIAQLAQQLIEGSTPVEKFGVEVGNHEVDSEILRDMEEAIAQMEGE